NIGIVYTPIHGTGVRLVPECLHAYGFNNVINVPEQDIPDGNFPTVKSPNPEEAEALSMAIKRAEDTGADIVMASDPDGDRVGVAVRDQNNEFILLNGNQTAALLIYYLLDQWHEKKKLAGNEFIVKTIVTSEILSDIAQRFDVKYFDTLTGFKYIAKIILNLEGKETFIGGGEESYGYLIGDFVRDKDAVSSCCMIAEMAAWAKNSGKTVFDLLKEIYVEFGFYKERLFSLIRKGKEGAEEIQNLMAEYRKSPPERINNSRVIRIKDIQEGIETDIVTGNITRIDLPKSNVLQFFLGDGSKISVRPSGTEPKIKYYFSVKEDLPSIEQYSIIESKLDRKLNSIINNMNLGG
ncbi:MAG: phospho-sugar mutase, partial [Bacteroidales bacterium]|nr:phospho-sugar mutase [Bacteroidales bacterium]